MRRNGFLAWHRRLALIFAPLLLLQALTGAVLVFHDDLVALIDPAPAGVSRVPVSTLVASAQASGGRVTRLFLPARQDGPAFAQLAEGDGAARYAVLDPNSGRVMREGGLLAFPVEAALQWHYRLMDGATGLAIVALNGLALVVLASSGLAFWWPAGGRWRKSLSVNARMPARVRLRQWHRSFGVVASAVILMSAATGILLSAPDVFAGAVVPSRQVPPPRPPAQIDAAVGLARSAFPRSELRDIRFPLADRIDVNLNAPERNPRAVHVVTVAVSQPKVLKAVPANESAALWMTVLPLHTGEGFGPLGRWFVLVEALVLAVLSITGPVMWWQARRLRK